MAQSHQQPILPETGFLRLPSVLKLFPVSKTCWWDGVSRGKYPKPVKLGPRITAWRATDIKDLLQKMETPAAAKPHSK